jgi:hypothetical protein
MTQLEFCSVAPPVPSARKTALSTLPVPDNPPAVLAIVSVFAASLYVIVMFVPAASKAETRSSTDSSKAIKVRTSLGVSSSARPVPDVTRPNKRPEVALRIFVTFRMTLEPTFYPLNDQQRINRSDPIATASKLNKSARLLRPKSLTTKTPQH